MLKLLFASFFMYFIWFPYLDNRFHHFLRERARLMLRGLGLGIVKQAGAKAHLEVIALQDIVITAPLASFPRLLVVGQLREGNRLKAQVGVHFHHGQPGSDAKYLGVGIELARKIKDIMFDFLCQSQPAVVGMYYQPRSEER